MKARSFFFRTEISEFDAKRGGSMSRLIRWSIHSSTAMRIVPRKLDFYFTKANQIADRILYEKGADGKWSIGHIAA